MAKQHGTVNTSGRRTQSKTFHGKKTSGRYSSNKSMRRTQSKTFPGGK